MPNKEGAKEWFEKAEQDLAAVETLLKEGTSPNVACFLCQQIAEKYLKGFLAYKDLHVRKIHDLKMLVDDCIKIDKSFEVLQDSARFLNQFYIESRYPDDYVEFSRDDAKQAYQEANKIKKLILDSIK